MILKWFFLGNCCLRPLKSRGSFLSSVLTHVIVYYLLVFINSLKLDLFYLLVWRTYKYLYFLLSISPYTHSSALLGTGPLPWPYLRGPAGRPEWRRPRRTSSPGGSTCRRGPRSCRTRWGERTPDEGHPREARLSYRVDIFLLKKKSSTYGGLSEPIVLGPVDGDGDSDLRNVVLWRIVLSVMVVVVSTKVVVMESTCIIRAKFEVGRFLALFN